MNKKGSLDDIVYIVVIVFGFALLLLIGGKFITSFNDQIQATSFMPDEGKTAVGQIDNMLGGVLDGSFLFLMIGLCLAAIVFASLVVIHPIFFIFYIIMLIIVIFVSAAISNVYTTAAADASMSAIANKLVMTGIVLQYLPLIIGIIGIIIAIIMYKTWQENR